MPEEVKDANPGSSLEGAIASSPEAQTVAQEVTQTPPAQEGVIQPAADKTVKEPPFHEHPRWKEVQQEREYLRQQNEQLMQMVQKSQAQPPQAPTDPYAGMTPEEKVFYQNVDARAEQKARQIVQQQITPQIEAAKFEFARIRAEQFFKDHPDVKPESPEETRIADKIRQGYLPEDAYRAVVWDREIGARKIVNDQTQQDRLKAKMQANVASASSISSQSNPSSNKKETYKDEIRRRLNTEWNGEI